jgi:hypothetical protein
VADTSDSDGQPSGDSGWRAGGFPILRACIVLVLFVAATVVVLSELHPTSNKSGSGTASAVTSSTSTTRPTTKKSTHSTTTTTTIPPNKVPVVVANASGVTGAAATISTQLEAGGWDLLPPVNATADVPTSHVYYVAGFLESAAVIASSLHLPPTAVAPYTTAVPISSIGTADVVVVAGPDLNVTPTTSTTTTVATTATTAH